MASVRADALLRAIRRIRAQEAPQSDGVLLQAFVAGPTHIPDGKTVLPGMNQSLADDTERPFDS